MRHTGRITLIALIGILSPLARADISGDIAQASAPVSQGIPEVAVVQLQALLNNKLSDTEWQAVAEKLAEAQVAAKQPEATLILLQDTRVRELSWAKFWRAQALAELKRRADALPLYEQVSADEGSSLHRAATFGAAEMLRALGKQQEALKRLNPLLQDPEWKIQAQLRSAELHIDNGDVANARRLLAEMRPVAVADRRQRRLLRARLELITHRPERAIGIFQALLKKPEGTPHATLIAALCGMAEAHQQLKTPEVGDDDLELFIDRHPADPDLPVLFEKLDELYRAERRPSRNELERWVRRPEQPRRTFARWYLARFEVRAGRRERARQLFSDLRTSAKSPEFAAALLEFAQFEIDDHHFNEAIAILDDARLLHPEEDLQARILFLSAQAQCLAKRFGTATVAYEYIAHSSSPWTKVALFNASSGWLQVGNHVRFAADYAELEKQGGDENARADLCLQDALMQAGKGDKQAAASLQQFIRDFPKNARVSEAWVALAELAFHSAPPRLDEARKDLARAGDSKPTAAAIERADYLRIWLEEAAGTDETKVIDLAKTFLQQHGASAFAPEVRTKLAELYYARQDFADAQTQFEIIAREHPDDPLAERALFFAAQSAMSSMGEHSLDQALVLFDEVVRKNGSLRWVARNQQAVIERKLGKPRDALALYDEVLKSDAAPAEKREALCAKGDIFFEAAAADPSDYQRAIAAYDELASDNRGPTDWRDQALFKKGLCLEKESDRSGALATFYKILEDNKDQVQRRDLFWFYKAGFNAARLLEEDSKWESR